MGYPTGISLKEAQANYKAAVEYEKKVLESGEQYAVNKRFLKRSPLEIIQKSIVYWDRICNEISCLEEDCMLLKQL